RRLGNHEGGVFHVFGIENILPVVQIFDKWKNDLVNMFEHGVGIEVPPVGPATRFAPLENRLVCLTSCLSSISVMSVQVIKSLHENQIANLLNGGERIA